MTPRRFPKRKRAAPAWDARASVLAEWRGADFSSDERARESAARHVGELVERLTAKLQLPRRRAESRVFSLWNRLVDPVVAAHARPAGLRNGTLFVHVDSSPWLAELVRYRRREMLERLQDALGRELVQRIVFRLG
ncbi:MAG: DUF721 domain-containing protein [Verrucomicrobia bacterium]|nr:DUF721 domain-containing protein [Verrucomicrobiota bacterium]